MKTRLIRYAVILSLILLSTGIVKSQDESKKTPLFNGKNLKNWVFVLRDPSVDPATVFYVSNGVIHVSGNPFGYMRTKKEYSDYNLHVEWRYPVEATNSGVFVHAQQPDTIWPKTIECQLAAGKAGDFICANGASMDEQKDKNVRVIPRMNESVEKPVGEWNTMDVKCHGNNIEVTVNGLLQNKGTGLNVSKGGICLQSEGKDIEFRNVYLTKIKK